MERLTGRPTVLNVTRVHPAHIEVDGHREIELPLSLIGWALDNIMLGLEKDIGRVEFGVMNGRWYAEFLDVRL